MKQWVKFQVAQPLNYDLIDLAIVKYQCNYPHHGLMDDDDQPGLLHMETNCISGYIWHKAGYWVPLPLFGIFERLPIPTLTGMEIIQKYNEPMTSSQLLDWITPFLQAAQFSPIPEKIQLGTWYYKDRQQA